MLIQMIRKLGNVLGLVGTVFWWTESKSWEPVTVAGALLVAYVVQEIHDSSFGLRPVDAELFGRFLQALPSRGAINYIKGHDMGGAISVFWMEQLMHFQVEWHDAEHEFLNKNLQKRLSKLLCAVDDYVDYFSIHTFTGPSDMSHARVYPELRESKPELVKEVVSNLHAMADKVVSLHEDLVREGRRRMNVPLTADEASLA